MDKSIAHSFYKTAGLLALASAFGFAVVGVTRYNAKASEILPRLSIANLTNRKADANQLRIFSVEIYGGQSRYEIFEAEFVDRGGDVSAVLTVKKAGRDERVETYEKTVDDASFEKLWLSLRSLEVAQLTDLSPSTESIGEKSEPFFQGSGASRMVASASYGFKFQDGLRDYPNSFEVYAPERLQDRRYQALRDLSVAFIEDVFDYSVM